MKPAPLLFCAFLLACASAQPPKRGLSREGLEIECTEIGPDERKFMSYPGYDAQGCSKSERMAEVSPGDPNDDELDMAVVDFAATGGTGGGSSR